VPRAVVEGEPGECPAGGGAQDAAVPQYALGSKQRRGKRLADTVGGRPGGSMRADSSHATSLHVIRSHATSLHEIAQMRRVLAKK
jgi:hypothetical protein